MRSPYLSQHCAWRVSAEACREARREGGFTLLELLVALALVGLIVAMLFGSLRFGIRVWEAGNETIEASAELRLVQGFIRRQLGQAFPVVRSKRSGDSYVEFDGQRDSLAFVAPMPAHLGGGGLYQITLTVERSSGDYSLLMARRLFHPDVDDDVDDDEPMVLIEGLRDIEFAYFGAEDNTRSPEWHSEWREMDRLPSLVRIAAEFPRDEKRQWPELVVAPVIDMDAGCIYDPNTKKCRNR